MTKNTIEFQPIGIVHTPFKQIHNMPIQPASASGIQGKLILKPEFTQGLRDLEGVSHVYLIYYLHKVKNHQLLVIPFMDTVPRGVFSTRAPKRPNPIGLSVVKLVSIENNILYLENVDMLDGTPVLDIKPYVPTFDLQDEFRVGWLKETDDEVKSKRSDGRFKDK